ncbi:MAG TPA: response regulator [Phycisphaerales bacterium]|nr:response regulator [Phycisphaerales bacterium]
MTPTSRPTPLRSPDAQPAAALPPLSIAALDDDADFREFIAGALASEGHDVRVCAEPEELYQACDQRLPDVVLLDMKMGRAGGEEVLREVRRRWPRLCVIVVTGYPSMDSMRETFKQDVFDYIAKPFSLDVLRAALGQAVARLGLGQRPQDKLRAELGRQVRMARTEAGLTLKELSESCGVSVSQLSSIERGTHLPSLESLVAIASSLKRKPSAWMEAAGL